MLRECPISVRHDSVEPVGLDVDVQSLELFADSVVESKAISCPPPKFTTFHLRRFLQCTLISQFYKSPYLLSKPLQWIGSIVVRTFCSIRSSMTLLAESGNHFDTINRLKRTRMLKCDGAHDKRVCLCWHIRSWAGTYESRHHDQYQIMRISKTSNSFQLYLNLQHAWGH